jgi:hypothetical protein
MRSRIGSCVITLWLAGALVLSTGPLTAHAARPTAAQLTEAIAKHREALREVRRADVTKAADREVAKLEDWLSQAQTDVAAGKLKQAKRLLIRIDAQAVMVREIVKMSNLEQQLEESRKALAAAQEALKAAQLGLAAAERRKKELEAKGY